MAFPPTALLPICRRFLGLAGMVAVMSSANIQAVQAEPGISYVPVSYADIPGWDADDHAAALAAFARSCEGPHRQDEDATRAAEASRSSAPPRHDPALERACAALLAAGDVTSDRDGSRAFFETWFRPHRVVLPDGARGRVTAYYEPVLDGALTRDERFIAPLFALPDDLVIFDPDKRPADAPVGLAAARRTGQGLEPYPDRAALSDPANWAGLEPLVWLENDVDAYFVHIQGSVRVRLADGRSLRLGYAGKNGYPYASAGRVMIERGLVAAAGLTAEAMKTWLKANPDVAPDILAVNRSYVFFRVIEGLAETLGPIGAEGVALTPKRSIAIDPAFMGYGLPLHISADLPTGPSGASEAFQQLMIAQDTGSAIRGPARGDLFWGTGSDAGVAAGGVNHPADFVVLLPRRVPAAK